MRRRSLTTLALTATLALLLGWLPTSAPVRERLAAALVDAAAEAGYAVTVADVGGYLWRGATLRDVRVVGAGVDLGAQRVALRWFLPALLVGELPLRVDVGGLGGRLALSEVAWPAVGEATGGLRLRLDDVRLDGSDLRVAEVPFDLPDLAVEQLAAAAEPDGGWRVELTLATAEGRLAGELRGRFGDEAIDVVVDRADATLVRHWWDGARAGIVRGAGRWTAAGMDGRFELTDGALRAYELDATDVAGPIDWRGDTLEAAWIGRVADGRVEARATIDLAALRWRVDADVDAALADASAALLALVGAPDLPTAAGRVTGTVAAHGWREVDLRAEARVDGTWLGADLNLPDLRVAFTSAAGLALSADGRWGDGPARVVAGPGVGTDWSLTVGPVDFLGIPIVSLTADLATGAGPVVGRATLRAGAGPWTLDAEVTADADGVRAFVEGSAWDGPIVGALAAPALRADAPLEGSLTWRLPTGWADRPALATATLAGSLAGPRAQVVVDGEGPLRPGAGLLPWTGVAPAELLPDLDLRGTVDVAWDEAGPIVAGRLGPLALAWEPASWTATLEPVALGGPLAGLLGPAEARGHADGWTASAATEVTSAARVPGAADAWVGLPEVVRWTASGNVDGWRAASADGTWSLAGATGAGGAPRIEVRDAGVGVAGRTGRLDAVGSPAAGSARWRGPGADLAVAWRDGGLDGVLTTGERRLAWAWRGGAPATAVGDVDLGVLAEAWAGAPGYGGHASLDLAWRPGEDPLPTGRADVAVVAPLPFAVQLAADGRGLTWRGAGELLGRAWASDGRWTPGVAPYVAGAWAWDERVELAIAADGLRGAGTWAGLAVAGVEVPAQAWSLRTTPDGGTEVAFGASRASFRPDAGRLDAVVDLTADWAGRPVRVNGTATWSSAAPDGDLALDVTLPDGAAAHVAGSRTGVTVVPRGPLATWAAALTPLFGEGGEAALAGDLGGDLRWSPDAGPSATLTWDDRLGRPVTVAWGAAGWDVRGTDWHASASPAGDLRLRADGADLATLLRRTDVALRLEGELAWPADGEAVGDIDLAVTTPFGDAIGTATGGAVPRLRASAALATWTAEADGALVRRGRDAGWAGDWRLRDVDGAPVPLAGDGTFAIGAAGAAVTGELRLAAGAVGPLAWPDLAAAIGLTPGGPPQVVGTTGVRGSWPAGLAAELRLADAPVDLWLRPDGTGLAADLTGAGLTASWRGDARAWDLRALAAAGPTALEVMATGSGSDAQGGWSLRDDDAAWAGGAWTLAGGALDVTLPGDRLDAGAALRALAPGADDLVVVAPATGLVRVRASAAGLEASGRIELAAVAGGTPVGVALALDGRAAALTLDLGEAGDAGRWSARADDLTAWPEVGIEVTGNAAGGPWRGHVRGGAEGLVGEVTGGTAWRASLMGGRAGRATLAGPAELAAELTWSTHDGLAADLRADAAGLALRASLAPPSAGEGAATLHVTGERPGTELAFELTGPLAPLDLRGSARVATNAAPLRVVAAPGPSVAWGDLIAGWDAGTATLRGDSTPGQLPFVALHDADLRWSPADGWGGTARASGSWPAIDLLWHADLVGSGPLHATATGDIAGTPVGTLRGALAPNPRDGAAGDADLAVALAPAADATLRATGTWSLDGAGPRADLALTLAGPTAATGLLTVRGDRLDATLAGPGLDVAGQARAGMAEATLRLRDVSLAAELPWLNAPRLDADAALRFDGEGLSWRVAELTLTTPSGGLQATALGRPDGAVEASARLDLDLADLRLDTPWSGKVRGPVSFDGTIDEPLAGTVAARLDLATVRWGALDAVWDAQLTATGAAGDPVLRAVWRADGPPGALTGDAAWRPAAGAVELQASGRVAAAELDLDLGLAAAGFTGGGHVAWNGDRWLLAAEDGRLQATGTGAWSDASASLDPEGWIVTLAADLAAVPALAGRLDGRLDLGAADRPRADLRLRDVVAAGITLGDVALAGDGVRGWTVDGAHLRGELAADLTRWRLDVADAGTGFGDTRLAGTLAADGGGPTLAARWSGLTPAGPVDLRADADLGGDVWRGRIHGEALGGTVDVPFVRDAGGWHGAGGLTDARVGDLPLRAAIEVGGSARVPDLAATLAAGADDAWRGDLRWSAGALRVDLALPLPDGRGLTARGNAWPAVDLVVDGGDAGWVRVTAGWREAPLRLDGNLALDLQALRLELQGPSTVRLTVPALGGGLRATLPASPLPAAVAEIRREGWRWIGVDGWTGTVRVARDGGPWLETDDLRLAPGDLRVDLRGAVAADGADLTAAVELAQLASAAGLGDGPWREPLHARITWDGRELRAAGVAPWSVDVAVVPAERRAEVRVDVAAGAPADAALAGDLRLVDARWSGDLRLRATTDALGGDPATIEADVRGQGDHLALSGVVRGPRGSLTAAGRWDAASLVPAGWGPTGPAVRTLDLRVVGLDLAGFAGAAAITGTVTGSASLRDEALFGRLTSEDLTLGDRREPGVLDVVLDLAADGGPRAEALLDLGGMTLQVDADTTGADAFLRMEHFPAHQLLAAAIGPSDVTAEITGAARIGWTWGDRVPDDLRIVGERIVLERAGVVTEGELSVTWDGAALTFGRTEFAGRGTWQVRGSATPAALDLELLALDADFGPLLGLLPAFALNGVSAQGDLAIRASGTPGSPDVVVRTDDLELLVAGTRYRLEDLRLTLRGAAWNGHAELHGLSPITGRVDLVTEGRVGPWPEQGFALSARAVGDLDVPYVGRVTDLDAELQWSDRGAASLEATGRLDAPFTVAGTLAPLDLRASGRDLRVTVPFLAVADAQLDADLRLVSDAGGPRLSGRLDAAQARLDLAVRGSPAPAAAAAVTARATASPVPRPPVDPRSRFRFDGVRLVAPQRVTFAESFGNAEAGLDLTLDGTLADPRLSGTIRAVRGTVRFAGRDLELTEALASFDPTRGVYPAVRLTGRTSFEKARVVAPGDAVRFLAPAGPRFTVDLLLEGEAVGGASGFALDLRPTLTSDALVEGLGGTGPRTPSELELLTLLTLGRLEASTGVAGAVAQSALDAAVDLLVTGEIQAALSEALGVEVVELRTTTVSSLIDGADPFGVSLRLGGYLSDEVFASYRVSTLAGDSLSNEVALAYQLGPVAIDVTGRFDVAAGAVATRGPSLAVGARYGFAPGLALEFGVDLSSERSTARLGVSWRW